MSKKIEREERAVNMPLTPKDCLNKVAMILAINKFNVEEVKPEKRTHFSDALHRPDIYVSPIEFLVNGISVALYGSRLVIDDKVDYSVSDTSNIASVYKSIEKKCKDKRATVKRISPTVIKRRSNSYAQYLESVTII